MRNLLLSTLFLFFGSLLLMGQNLMIYDTEGNQINGTTINVAGPIDISELVEEMKVFNNGSSPIDVKMRKRYLSVVEGTSNYFCVGLSCFPPSIFNSNAFNVGAGQYQNDLASCHYFPNQIEGTTTIMYTFYNADEVNHPGDSTSVTINFMVPLNIIPVLSSSMHVYPNPASDLVNITFNAIAFSTGHISIYNMLGSEVKKLVVNEKSGKVVVRVDDLVPGVYFYKLIADQKVLYTDRLVIRR